MAHLLRHTITTIAAVAALIGGGSAVADAESPPFDPIDEITDDPCDPVEEQCDVDPDPEPNPELPDGPDDFTDDPCDPVEEQCGDDPEPQPDPEGTPEVSEDDGSCDLDEVCVATPTFTG